MNDKPFLPPVDGLVVPVEIGVAADEALLDQMLEAAAEAATLDPAWEVAKVVGTETAAEEDAAPGKLIDEYWKNPPAATLDVATRLTESLVDTDDESGATVGEEAADIEGAPVSPPAGGETVMVTHSVVVVVLVEPQELAATASTSTFSTPWTAPPYPPAAEALLAGTGATAAGAWDVEGSGTTVTVAAAVEAGAAAVLAAPLGPPADVPQPPVLL